MVEYPIVIAHWQVYIHINKINEKKYVGITNKKKATSRWGTNGQGYKTTRHFYAAIQKYGWNNFEHFIIQQNLSRSEASVLEEILIKVWNLTNPNFGYNFQNGGFHGNVGKEMPLEDKQKRMGSNNHQSKKVVCLNTGTVYDSYRIAAKENCIKASSEIGLTVMGQRQFAGHDKNGIPLIWVDYEYYQNMTKNEIEERLNRKIKTTNSERVICLNTGQVFSKIKEASEYGGSAISGIIRCAQSWIGKQSGHRRFFSGKNPDTGEKLSWIYEDDYKKLTTEERLNIFDILKNKGVIIYGNYN